MHQEMDSDPDFWRKRPLQSDQIIYSASDVENLIKAFNILKQEIVENQDKMLFKTCQEYSNTFIVQDRDEDGSTRFGRNNAPAGKLLELFFEKTPVSDQFSTPFYRPYQEEQEESEEEEEPKSEESGFESEAEDSEEEEEESDSEEEEEEKPKQQLSQEQQLFTNSSFQEFPIGIKSDLEFESILRHLPSEIQESIKNFLESEECKKRQSKNRFPLSIFEIVVDIGREISIRFSDDTEHFFEKPSINRSLMNRCVENLFQACNKDDDDDDDEEESHQEENYPSNGSISAQKLFTSDNRAGISGTLHRISCMRARDEKKINGLTYRIGRHIANTAGMIMDILESVANENKSLLLLGIPGVGKTTLLREIARVLSMDFKKRVVIIDTSSEIGGDGDSPHPCIGRARRMIVAKREQQHKVMIEAVQNHSPQVIIIDEIGTREEAAAAKTIAQRGVTLVGTAHGKEIRNLMKNGELVGLIGGIEAVILGDSAAKEMAKQQNDQANEIKKTKLERKGAATFGMLIELREKENWNIFHDVEKSVDQMLNHQKPLIENRWAKKISVMAASLMGEEDDDEEEQQPQQKQKQPQQQRKPQEVKKIFLSKFSDDKGFKTGNDNKWFSSLMGVVQQQQQQMVSQQQQQNVEDGEEKKRTRRRK